MPSSGSRPPSTAWRWSSASSRESVAVGAGGIGIVVDSVGEFVFEAVPEFVDTAVLVVLELELVVAGSPVLEVVELCLDTVGELVTELEESVGWSEVELDETMVPDGLMG